MNKFYKKSLFLVVLGTFFFLSCSSTPEMNLEDENFAPVETTGYVYGSFALFPATGNAVPVLIGEIYDTTYEGYDWGHPTIALTLGESTFKLRPNKEDMLQMVALPAGTYSFTEGEVYTYEEGDSTKQVDLGSYNNIIEVKPNVATYIGDFSGTLGRDFSNEIVWTLNEPEDNFSASFVDIQTKYPLLKEYNVEIVSHFE